VDINSVTNIRIRVSLIRLTLPAYEPTPEDLVKAT